MKTRNGFISNSSSSSFVVAFPRKPKTEKELVTMMFGTNEHGTVRPYDFYEGISNQDIAKRVFADIMNKKPKTKKSEVVSEFSTRYFCLNKGKPYYEKSKYCSTNSSLMARLMRLEDKHDASEKVKRAVLKKRLDQFVPEVPHAYKDGKKNWQTGELFTDEEVAAYEKYVKAKDKFTKTDKIYVKLQKKFWDILNKRWKEVRKLRDQLATIDTNKFYADHKRSFIIVLTYGDESGDGTLEHGGIFRNLPHVHISHH